MGVRGACGGKGVGGAMACKERMLRQCWEGKKNELGSMRLGVEGRI